MIGLQMGALQSAIMRWTTEFTQAPTPEAVEHYQRGVTKLMGAFAALVEMFKRYRSKGEQKVTVQHVSIQDGGQAIVSQNVSRARRRRQKKQAAGPASALTDSKTVPMEILVENRDKDEAETLAAVGVEK